MTNCRPIRAMLPRAAEGEISPADSLRLARHLPRCTACRILLARERRLAEMLDAIEDTLPVQSEFAARVMGALPEGPPPARASALVRARRRGLGIAGIVGLVGVGTAILAQLARLGPGRGPLPGLPHFTLEGMDSLLEILGGLVRLVMLVVAQAGAGLEPTLPCWPGAGDLSPVGFLPMLAVLLMLSTLVALAGGGYGPVQAIPRVFMRVLSFGSEIPRRRAVAGRLPRSSVRTRRT
jgi:hypothetical protein